jgi:glycosyltransferase involved in cell wall biosynthesis
MADNKLKITIVEQRGSGGMIHYAYQLCTALEKVGADVTLVTSNEYELENYPHNFHVVRLLKLWSLKTDPLLTRLPRNKLEAAWIKLFWNVRRAFRGIRFVLEWIKLSHYLVKTYPDIVQFGVTQFQFEGIFYAYLRFRGLILSQICHEFESRQSNQNPFIRWADRLYYAAFKNFNVLFLHGESNKKRFLSLFDFPENRLYSIRHGNEQLFPDPKNDDAIIQRMRRVYKLNPSQYVILFFGNLTPSKGIPELIQAFKKVNAKEKLAKLVIAGMPSKYMDMNEIHKLVDELGIKTDIAFDSRYLDMEEIGPLVKLSTVVVFPYRNITQSGALQVAYAFGRPVVATNVGGFPEAVDEGKSGFLVPPEAPHELADAILRIISDPALTKQMGSYAKHLSETRFAWEPIAHDILAVYENIKQGNPA